MPTSLTIGIKATQIGPGGGLTHLVNCLKWFPILAPETKFIVYAGSAHERFLKSESRNVALRFYHIPSICLPARLLWEQTALPELLSRDKCDLLFEPGNYSIKNPPCPSVQLIHNLAPFIPEYVSTESAYQKLRLRILRHSTKSAIASSAGTIFLSHFAHDVLRHHLDLSCTQSTVIYHGATDQAIHPQQSREPFILCVSHIYRYKGILELVKAYAHAVSISPDLPKLAIAGYPYDNQYMARIDSIISRCGIGERVRFLGSVGEDQLNKLYTTCEYFVYPSTIENCPNILIEALAAGCPILTNSNGVMPEICGDAARYCEISDIPAMSESLLALHRTAAMRESLSERAAKRALFFSWRTTSQQTLDFFNQILRRSTPEDNSRRDPATCMAMERR